MLLAFDIGNSSISVGVFTLASENHDSGLQLVSTFNIFNKTYSSDEFTYMIRDFLNRQAIGCAEKENSFASNVNCAVISSVVPNVTDLIADSAHRLTGTIPLIISSGIKTGFGIKIKNPEQLGSDIVANAAEALYRLPPPLVILDVGTATTLTIVDEGKNVVGTIICPGIRISLNALTNSAALIGETQLSKNNDLIGKDTSSAICSGVINGNALMVDGFIRNIRELLNTKSSGTTLGLIATGGLAEYVTANTRNAFTVLPSLTLYGAARLFMLNRKNVVF